MLYTQMLYYENLFDSQKLIKKYEHSSQIGMLLRMGCIPNSFLIYDLYIFIDTIAVVAKNTAVTLASTRNLVNEYMALNARRFVDLGAIFETLNLSAGTSIQRNVL
jgi:hypothetical protein